MKAFLQLMCPDCSSSLWEVRAWSLQLAQLTFLYKPELPALDGAFHSELGPPTSIISQENAPTDMPTGQSKGGNSTAEAPPSQVTLVCVKLTTMNHPTKPSTEGMTPLLLTSHENRPSPGRKISVFVGRPVRHGEHFSQSLCV